MAVLRDKLEASYQADVASNSQGISQIQKEGVNLWTELMKAKEARLPRAEEAVEREETEESMLEWSLVEKHFENESLQTSSDMGGKLGACNVTVRNVALCYFFGAFFLLRFSVVFQTEVFCFSLHFLFVT